MTWLYPAIIAIVSLSVGSILERVLMKDQKSDYLSYAAVFQVVLGMISLVIAILFGRFQFPSDPAMIYRFMLATILWSGSTVFSFKAMQHLGAGEVTILGSAGTVLTIGLSINILHEQISFPMVIGICLILAAMLLVVSEKLTFNSKSGIFFALLTAACAAIAVINDAFILTTYEPFSYMAVMSFLPGFFLLSLFLKRVCSNLRLFTPSVLSTLVIFALVYSIQGISYYVAMQDGAPLSQLSPLIKLSTILTVILAALFLGERSHLLKKTVAAIIATLGAILIG